MASRVSAELRKDTDTPVEIVKGGLGEFSVYFDDRKVIDTSRMWYPNPGKIVKRIRALLPK